MLEEMHLRSRVTLLRQYLGCEPLAILNLRSSCKGTIGLGLTTFVHEIGLITDTSPVGDSNGIHVRNLEDKADFVIDD